MLIPSTITARRSRRYTSTLYIHRTIRKVGYNPIDGGGRYRIQPPLVSNLPATRSTLTPPITHHCVIRRTFQNTRPDSRGPRRCTFPTPPEVESAGKQDLAG